MATTQAFVTESELSYPLESYRIRNANSKPKFAQVTRKSNGQYVTFQQAGKEVIDVITWGIDKQTTQRSAKALQAFFDSPGFPEGRIAVIVILGE